MENTIQQAYMRPKEASKYLGIGLSTLWLFIKNGKFIKYKLSDRVTVLKVSELDEFANNRSVPQGGK